MQTAAHFQGQSKQKQDRVCDAMRLLIKQMKLTSIQNFVSTPAVSISTKMHDLTWTRS